MERNFEGTDRGKRVVTNDGAGVGTVVRVDGDRAHVLLDAERRAPNRPDDEGAAGGLSTVTIERNVVAHATNEVVRLEDSTTLSDDRRIV